MRRLSSESTKNTYSTLNVTVGTVRKSIAIVPAKWVRRNVPHVVDGGRRGAPGRFGMYLETVSLLTSWPSLASSAAMRRLLQVRFSRVMRSISSITSAESGGRPRGRDLYAQNLANPRRCQVITVAGFTIAGASAHRDHTRETTTQNARSTGRSGGRGLARLRTASC